MSLTKITWPFSRAVKTLASHARNTGSSPVEVTRDDTVEVMTETEESKGLFEYEINISLPYKTEKGVSPRATVEGIIPSGLANHNAQGECAIALYLAPWTSG